MTADNEKTNSVNFIEEKKKEFSSTVARIKKILDKYTDRNDIKDADKATLRAEYAKAANIAKTLSKRITDEKESEDFRLKYSTLSNIAASYGSAMKSTIPTTKLEDVKGLDNVKELIKSFLFMIKNEDLVKHYKLAGGLGLLMYGAPGTGKTMFAEAIANAMNLPLFIVTPADIFKSYVGESEQAVKQIFEEIDACEDGAILFIDECESIFSRRDNDTKDYKAAVTTELLQRMNGFGVNGAKRIMIAATNRPDEMDPAYLRYKRFSHLVHITPPDDAAMRAIVEGKLSGIELEANLTVDDVMAMADNYRLLNPAATGSGERVVKAFYSAADVCAIIEEAARNALTEIEEKKLTKPIPLSRDMFRRAFNKIPPSIKATDLIMYENFRNIKK